MGVITGGGYPGGGYPSGVGVLVSKGVPDPSGDGLGVLVTVGIFVGVGINIDPSLKRAMIV